MVKFLNWQEADQLAIYKCSRGVELGATKKQLQLVSRAGLEPENSRFHVWHPNRWATLSPWSCFMVVSNRPPLNRPSLGGHVESQENEKLCFCAASLTLYSHEACRAKAFHSPETQHGRRV